MKLKIVTLTRNQPTPTELTVVFQALDDADAVLKEFSHAFPLDIVENDLTAALQKVIATYEHDLKLAADSAAQEEANEAADALKASMEGKIL